MRLRLVPVLAVSLSSAALSVPAARASQSLFTKGG
jgi:hypothetical protein